MRSNIYIQQNLQNWMLIKVKNMLKYYLTVYKNKLLDVF